MNGGFTKIFCPTCKRWKPRTNSAINRAKKVGAPVYCSKKCSGIGRQKNISDKEKRRLKAEYDREYREKNRERKKRQAHEYHLRTYDPAKAAVVRKERMPYHVEYCRQPEYKVKKKVYDRKKRKEKFGEFGEAYEILLDIVREVKKQMPDRFERYAQVGRQQWNPINQQRRRRARTAIINSE